MYNFKEPDADPINMRLNFKGFQEPPSLLDIKLPFPTDAVDWNNHNFNELQSYEVDGVNYGYTLLVAIDNLGAHGINQPWASDTFAYCGIWFPKVYGKQFLTGMLIWGVYGWRVALLNPPSVRTEYPLTGFNIDLTLLTSSIFYQNRDSEFDTPPASQYIYYLGRTFKETVGYGGRGAFFATSVDWGNKSASIDNITLAVVSGYYIGRQTAWDTRRATFQDLTKASGWPFGTNPSPAVDTFLPNTFVCPTDKQDMIPSNFWDITSPINNPKTGMPV